MGKTAIVIDGFFKDPEQELRKALDAKYETIEHNGLSYEGICKVDDEENSRTIEQVLGVGFREKTVMYRQYRKEYSSKTYIHSDILISSYTTVVFLTPPEKCFGGLAFWKHKLLGWEAHPIDIQFKNEDYPQQIYKDGFDEDMWEMIDYVPMYFNRAVIFNGARYHSRYPYTLNNERLIKVYFGKV